MLAKSLLILLLATNAFAQDDTDDTDDTDRSIVGTLTGIDDTSCEGCSSTSTPAAGASLGLLALGLIRRRSTPQA